MENQTLILDISKSELDFVKTYAEALGISVSELIERYIKRLEMISNSTIDAEIEKVSGILPHDVHASDEYMNYLMQKHS